MVANVKKTIRVLLYGAGLTALLVLCIITGMYMERKRKEDKEMRKEHVSDIAVVNMDDGIVVGESRINYASQLMDFPGDNFIVTGLNDARAGIENGTYAACIVIPETFSASVTSLEREPRKVVLNYQYNLQLDEESGLQAVNDVNAFITMLNSNTAYMYMDAIMAQYHRVQDDSSTILSNDNTELELLAGIDAARLIAMAEPVEEIVVERDIEPVELDAYRNLNSSLMEALYADYADAVQEGKNDFAVLKETNAEAETVIDDFQKAYRTVIDDTVAGQAALLETGHENLAEAVGHYNEEIDRKQEEAKEAVEEILNEQRLRDQREANERLEELYPEDVSGNNPKKERQGSISGNDPDGGDVSGNDPGGEENDRIRLTKPDEEQIGRVTDLLLELFQAEAESEEIAQVLQEYYVDALYEECEEQMTRMEEEEKKLGENLEKYEKGLLEYDPMQYIERADMESRLDDINDNAGKLFDSVEQNNTDYLIYAEDVYSATAEQKNLLRDSLDEAGEQTAANVEECIGELKLSREAVNSENVSLLGGFAGTLEYTRVGSQGNTAAYDHIINPVLPQVNSRTASNTEENTADEDGRGGGSMQVWLFVVLGIGIVACLTEIFFSVRQQYKKSSDGIVQSSD